MLEVKSLRANYDQRVVLNEISFNVQPGTILALIGPNGAGKTSLIRALSGVLRLTGGEVCINGQNIASLKPDQLARCVAVVPQARSLPPAFTGWELTLLGRTPHLNWLGRVTPKDEVRARQALERAQACELAERRIGELSGGEQQRLLLARALAQEAPILLLDEPTTHLDLQYQISLLDSVRDLVRREQLSVIVALHDLNLVSRYADYVALLVDGRLRAVGTPAEVIQPELLGQAYHLPFQILNDAASGHSVIMPKFIDYNRSC